MSQQQEPPKIEFPCDYPIKVIGDAEADLRTRVIEIMRDHADVVYEERITERMSREGRFLAVTITIVATGQPQLENIFTDLKATGIVKMVL
ncbi:DUF493 domain-containing protein [Spongiibacter sp. KMU-158]|uniref:UPF0250 protein IB286_07570 n=1 Tax=Spongiibacter pelagi TaxID=2760804 RepID=A0A927C090_9GAMM|nr:DUF493 domain-containing protein [Spongiibacter pelagi]MBD2858869.1 DUF493 domain-containing protein [Spongiibacter pelagi]